MIERLREILIKTIKAVYPQIDPPVFSISQPAKSHGDLATNISFAIAKEIKKSPQEISDAIAKALYEKKYLTDSIKTQNGFINIGLHDRALEEVLDDIIQAQNRYGDLLSGEGKKIRIEFISANPTGPLHIGNARGGPLGDTIANVFRKSGYTVFREYYHNDVGGQMIGLGQSIINIQHGQPLDAQEYRGEYVKHLAKKINPSDNPRQVGHQAVGVLLHDILNDVMAMGITFDAVQNESDFIYSGKTKQALDILTKKGILKTRDGAVWFAPNDDFFKDRESVVIKSDGEYTYFANDIAYHWQKFQENYDIIVDVFGPDHHGHIPKIKAAISAFGFDGTKFHPITYQWVRLRRAGKIIEMSKRLGTFVTARELLDEVGKDIFRFFMLMHDHNTHIDFDLDLSKKRSHENPVYYVQYAAVRAKAIMTKIQNPKSKIQKNNVQSKTYAPVERQLIIHLAMFPSLIKEISESFKVHLLAHYAIDTARLFHDFYEQCPVIMPNEHLRLSSGGENKSASSSNAVREAEGTARALAGRSFMDHSTNEPRSKIVKATLVVLENTLELLGISIPNKM